MEPLSSDSIHRAQVSRINLEAETRRRLQGELVEVEGMVSQFGKSTQQAVTDSSKLKEQVGAVKRSVADLRRVLEDGLG